MQRTLTAIYDTRSAAEAVRDELVGLGVPSANIVMRGTESGAASTTTATEDKGFWASLADLFVPDEDRHTYAEGLRRGGYLLTAQVPDGMEDQAIEILERSGAVDIDERAESWRQSGWTGYQAGQTATGTGTMGERASMLASGQPGTRTTDLEGGETIQAAEEQLHVGKREVGRGSVRVRSYVVERPVEEQVALRQERVTVERRPVDRELQPGEAAFQERTIEAVERGEEAVVDKRARVTEEIGVRKDVATETETVRDTVRKQEVEVEEDRAGGDLAGEERVTTPRDRTAG
jgi:uncharacterized protein (TIGR02271 family)